MLTIDVMLQFSRIALPPVRFQSWGEFIDALRASPNRRVCAIEHWLLRHPAVSETPGQSAIPGQFRLRGRGSNNTVSPEGMACAFKTAEALEDITFDAVFSSPLTRAFFPVQVMAHFNRWPAPSALPGLAELDMGDAAGCGVDSYLAPSDHCDLATTQEGRFLNLIQTWREQPQNLQFPGGESLPKFIERQGLVERTMAALLGDQFPLRTLSMGHGFGAMAWLANTFDVAPRDFFKLPLLGNLDLLLLGKAAPEAPAELLFVGSTLASPL